MIELTTEGMRGIFPRAPAALIAAFVQQHAVIDRAGITTTRTRMAFCFSNVEHECNGYALPGLAENLNYTPERAFVIFKTRLAMNKITSVAQLVSKFGRAGNGTINDKRGFFNLVYGTRMGNRPGTDDGFNFIGRGGPQCTGREAYELIGRMIGVDLVSNPARMSDLSLQPAILAAFWTWKKLNPVADTGNFTSVVRIWNGGTNGLADREHLLEGNNPVIKRLATADDIREIAKVMPGDPPTPFPTDAVLAAATSNERGVRNAGATATAGSSVAAKGAAEVSGNSNAVPSWVVGGGLALALAIVVVVGILIYRKKKAVKANWS